MAERLARLALALVGLTLAGCASMLPVTSAPQAPAGTPAPQSAETVPTPRPAPPPGARTAVDTTAVSAEGRAVLAGIPEPLPAGERVPAPTREQVQQAQAGPPGPGGVSMPAPEAASDTLRLASPAPTDSAAADVPVPAPTQPLGDRPGTIERLLASDTTAAAAPPTGTPPPSAAPGTRPTPPASTAPAARPAPSPPTTGACWRVQVGAPADRARADGLRAAAESQMMVPFVVEREKGLYKVRTRRCVDGEAAESLKRRATLAGFSGVFKFTGAPR